MNTFIKDPLYALSVAALVIVAASAAVMLTTGGTSTEAHVSATSTPRPTEVPATVPAVTAEPTGTPDTDKVALDFGRALDLGTIRDTLTEYHDANGAYPDSNGQLVVLCVDSDGPGCVLTRFNADIPFNDGLSPYWYLSDGETYTLVARAALEQPNNGTCPSPLPEELTNAPVMCMNGGPG